MYGSLLTGCVGCVHSTVGGALRRLTIQFLRSFFWVFGYIYQALEDRKQYLLTFDVTFRPERYIRRLLRPEESPVVKGRSAHAAQSQGTEVGKGHKPF